MYYVEMTTQPGTFVAIKHGESGYYPTSIGATEADVLNRNQGHTPAEIKAAEVCSMFNNWKNFDSIVATS